MFFDNFFKVIIDGKNEKGPNWVCLGETIDNNQKDNNGFKK